VVASSISEHHANALFRPFDRGDFLPIHGHLYHWVPPSDGRPEMSRLGRSDYVLVSGMAGIAGWRMFLQNAAAPRQQIVFFNYLRNFSLVAVLMGLAILAAQILSMRISRPLSDLAEVSTGLPFKITNADSVVWTDSRMSEINKLVGNFKLMTEALRQRFRQLRRAKEAVERQSARLSQALAELRESSQSLEARSIELERANEQLRAEVAERQRAEEALQRSNRVKDEFLATLSHELRTPLNVILGHAHLLREVELSGTELAQSLEAIERNASVQAQLVGDLLDLSRIIKGEFSLEKRPVNLIVCIEMAVASVQLAAAAKRIKIVTALETPTDFVHGDEARLQQVVWNLLSNAVKFTPKGGEVHLTLRYSDGLAEIFVSDTGYGIEAGFLPFVFDRFRQEDSSLTRRFGGLGMGLAIVRYVVELHGGQVEASSPGRDAGASFLVRLPLASSGFFGQPLA